MIKQKISSVIKGNKLLNLTIYRLYGKYCDRRYGIAKGKVYASNCIKADTEARLMDGYIHEGKINIWFLLEQGHSNVGDIAIGFADQLFYSKYFPDIKMHYVHEPMFDKHYKYFCKTIKQDDIIVLTGGGSIGDGITHEKHREKICRRFRKNIIISMPQTMCFSNSKRGEKALLRAKKSYKCCDKLCLVAREYKSYELMKSAFSSTNVILTPDIVMSLDFQQPKHIRNGIILCFRHDGGKKITNQEEEYIENICELKTDSVKRVDTMSHSQYISFDNRECEIQQIISEFKKARLVITDRLHGMIFCAISGTPCIALTNNNHKVRGSYEWLKNLNYVRYCDDVNNIEPIISELYNIGETHYDASFTEPYFEQIICYINEHIKSSEE